MGKNREFKRGEAPLPRLLRLPGNVILNEVKNLDREEILQSLRSFRMTENHYRIACKGDRGEK